MKRYIYSHGPKYRHPCNCVRKYNPSLRKLLRLQMFWYSRIFFFCLFSLEQHKTEKKSQIWCNSTKNPQNALDKIISNINLIFVSILAMTESLSIIYYYMMLHIFLTSYYLVLECHWMQILRYTGVTSTLTEWPKKLSCVSTSSGIE